VTRFEVVVSWNRKKREREKRLFSEKKLKKNFRIFVVSQSVTLTVRHVNNTPLRGTQRQRRNTTREKKDERSKKVDSSDGQSSGGESSRGDENERGDFVARNRRK